MRPQIIGLALASAITGVFLAAVAFVLVAQNWPEDRPRDPNRGFAINFAPQIAFDNPAEDLDFPNANQEPIAPAELPKFRGNAVAIKDMTVSEPITHGNLTVFLIHGPDTIKDAQIMTLEEALNQNQALVQDGWPLMVTNRSNTPLFLQSGDIFKGGNQDRTVPYDMLIPPLASRVPVTAWCVEAGRSSPRMGEISHSFQTSTESLPTRRLKLAAFQNQNAVWSNIKNTQDALTQNVGVKVNAALSPTSLQLSLEHPQVKKAVEGYVNAIAPATAGKDDVIGYVIAVNGKVQSADIYASSSLFIKLWPKLVRAGAVDALTERRAEGEFAVPTEENVQAFLNAAEQGQATRVQSSNRSVVIRHDSAQMMVHDTCVPSQNNLVLHRSFLVK